MHNGTCWHDPAPSPHDALLNIHIGPDMEGRRLAGVARQFYRTSEEHGQKGNDMSAPKEKQNIVVIGMKSDTPPCRAGFANMTCNQGVEL